MTENRIGNRVLVIGSPGSGKSTFAKKLRERTGLSLYYLDLLYHRPDRTTVSKEVFDKALAGVLEEEKWIIDGNYLRTLPVRLSACDTVFFFDLPAEECIRGAEERIGKKREDMPWVEESFDPEFRRYILDFPMEQTPKIRALLDEYGEGKQIVRFQRREEADAFLSGIEQKS